MSNTEMSPTDWTLTIFLSCLPVIGLILMFIWAFGSGTNPVKMNYAKGALILFAIIIVLYVMIIAIFGDSLVSSLM